MDLSRRGQSRDAEGRHPAARPGLGPWVGARVASPRCPILRPGSSSVFGHHGHPAIPGWVARSQDGAEEFAWDRVPGPGGCTRIPAHEEDCRRGAGFDVLRYYIII